VTLEAGEIYYLVSQEFNAGDQWYDFADSFADTFSPSVGTYIGAVDADGVGGGFSQDSTSSQTFVPPNFKVQA
jgi:hypothetical protein